MAMFWIFNLCHVSIIAVNCDENKKPVKVPPLKAMTDEDSRRYREAIARRELRLSEKKKESRFQSDAGFKQ